MTTVPISLNLDAETLERLAERERETGQTQSELAEQYIEEGLRMQRHPGIFFQDGATGRRAVLRGGPDVWEAIQGIQPVNGDGDAEVSVEEAASWLGLSPWIMQAAMNYYAEFTEEIDERIALNRQAYDGGIAAWRAAQGLPPE